MKKTLLPILVFAKIDIRRLFRDKVAIFFTFVFPLLFLLVFGGIFGRNGSVSFSVALLNQSNTQFAKDFVEQSKQDTLLKVDPAVTDLDTAKERMTRGELDATIILPAEFGTVGDKGYPAGQAQVLYNKNSQEAAQTLTSILNGIFTDINKQFVSTDMPFTAVAKTTDTGGLKQLDYVFSGLLGFALLSLGVFGPTTVFPKLKERGVLRRYHTTTLKVWQYFMGNVLSNAMVGILSIATMFIAGVTLFDVNMNGNYLDLLVLVVLSATMLFGIGLAVGGWANNEKQAAPLAQIVAFPMMFLSGSFFPRFLMPEWLQGITGYLPLTPVIDAARLIVTEGRGVLDLLPQFGLIAGWLVVIYLLAFRFFRWE